MNKFFTRFGKKKIKLSFEEIIPRDDTAAAIRENAVYLFYVDGIVSQKVDEALSGPRVRALRGELEPEDCSAMDNFLEHETTSARYEKEANERVYAYHRVKCNAMLISQVLFVNNSIREGLLDRINNASVEAVSKELYDYIKKRSLENGAPVTGIEAEFYSTLFILQTAFDRHFVPGESIVNYIKENGDYTGECRITDSYNVSTSYLELTNRRVIEAHDAEKKLCYNITTAWSRGIDLPTWNSLNKYYYEAKSPTTGKANLFTKNYDILLERMLPQFALSRVRLAEELLKKEFNGEKLRILEVGAGSGALAIDLMMACKKLKIPASLIEYRGIEPSAHMRDNFKANIEGKIGNSQLPADWKLEPGSLETLTGDPAKYLKNENTVLVFSFSAHHCFSGTLHAFFNHKEIEAKAKCIYVLDGVKEHGWTKPYYMWADCESPENFENVVQRGVWNSETLWLEPAVPIEGYAVTNAWCSLRKLTI
ncbi:MAG: hypothetical protein GY757_42375 [bacterium]|nr:hypothetical protein [bacterium]